MNDSTDRKGHRPSPNRQRHRADISIGGSTDGRLVELPLCVVELSNKLRDRRVLAVDLRSERKLCIRLPSPSGHELRSERADLGSRFAMASSTAGV